MSMTRLQHQFSSSFTSKYNYFLSSLLLSSITRMYLTRTVLRIYGMKRPSSRRAVDLNLKQRSADQSIRNGAPSANSRRKGARLRYCRALSPLFKARDSCYESSVRLLKHVFVVRRPCQHCLFVYVSYLFMNID